MEKFRVGIVGATGMVGQRFVSLLSEHPWFDITAVAASRKSAGRPYREAVAGRWAFPWEIPAKVADMIVMDGEDVKAVSEKVDFIFCAVVMDKQATRDLEEAYPKNETPVVSNNSACRLLPDVPMLIPEINASHLGVIPALRKRLGCKRGLIVVKPNCSIQSYVPALTPLHRFGLRKISACTYQAISGAGKTFASFPEILDNVIPFIPGEEEKSEQEPLKVWGHLSDDGTEIVPLLKPVISAQCLRVPVSDGHMAAVSVTFMEKPSREEILSAWRDFPALDLPSAPHPFVKYMEEPDRPQTRLDRDFERGMGVTVGRLREDSIFDYKFVCLSHNTLRGAAGGGVLSAELLCKEGYIARKEG